MATFTITTLGCKVNQYDAVALSEALGRRGIGPARDTRTADLAVVHTCCITAAAMRKSRHAIRRIRRLCPEATVLVTGCYGDYDAQTIRRILTESGLPAERALVAGNQDDLAAILEQVSQSLEKQCGGTSIPTEGFAARRNDQCMSAGTSGRESELSKLSKHTHIKARRRDAVKRNVSPNAFLKPISSFPDHQRAFVKVQDGCDAFCSYCVVPYTRPVLWSRPLDEVRTQCQDLLRAGHKEIVLSGVFLGAYGRTTARRRQVAGGKRQGAEGGGQRAEGGEESAEVCPLPPSALSAFSPPPSAFCPLPPAFCLLPSAPCLLPSLVRAIRELPGLWRVRLSSLEPLDLTEELLDACNHPAVAPHFHLPLQSGSAAILAKMNRQYTPDQYRACADRLREAIPRVAITTDIIVGFPRETDDDFAATLDMARHVGFARIHAFPFSPIDGTAAWLWRKHCPPPPVVHERMRRLADLQRELAENYRRQFIGETMEALMENTPARAKDLVAMTDRYISVHIPRASDQGGQKAGGGGQKAEGRRQEAGGRGQGAEGTAPPAAGKVVQVRIDSLHEDGLSGWMI